MQRALKTQLKLNNKQKTLMAQHAGYSRWVWNWALNLWNQAYEAGLKPFCMKFVARLNTQPSGTTVDWSLLIGSIPVLKPVRVVGIFKICRLKKGFLTAKLAIS